MGAILVTGASGFVGRALVDRLRGIGAEVRGVDLVADPERGVIAGDVTGPGAWQEAAAGCELVVHTAAIVSNAATAQAAWRVGVLGTRRALDAATRAGVGRFVHLSSVRAFGDLGWPDGVTEEYPVRPDGNVYVDMKIAAEQVVLQAHAAGEIGVTVIRPGDVYGPGSRPWTVLPVELIRTGRFALPAMGRGIFSPVYIENLLDGILLAARTPAGAGRVLTVTDGVGIENRAFFGHYARMVGRRLTLLPTPVALAGAAGIATVARLRRVPTEINPVSMRYFLRTGTYSIDAARALLGYAPAVGLEAGMARTETWLRERGLVP